ncbi:MAG: hypothetical protein SA339_13145 [Methanomassiliicoccus sp.]|nr:hypothetical protein [Methanomassiliicoccus sp.]
MAYTDAELRRPSGFALTVLLFLIVWLVSALIFVYVVVSAGVHP